MSSRLVDPRMMQVLERDFFAQLCTIEQHSTDNQDTTGEPVTNDWVAIAELTALKCRVGGITGGERRTNDQIYLDATHIIELTKAHPEITSKMRAVVDGLAYDILLPVANPEGNLTRLITRIVQ